MHIKTKSEISHLSVYLQFIINNNNAEDALPNSFPQL